MKWRDLGEILIQVQPRAITTSLPCAKDACSTQPTVQEPLFVLLNAAECLVMCRQQDKASRCKCNVQAQRGDLCQFCPAVWSGLSLESYSAMNLWIRNKQPTGHTGRVATTLSDDLNTKRGRGGYDASGLSSEGPQEFERSGLNFL